MSPLARPLLALAVLLTFHAPAEAASPASLLQADRTLAALAAKDGLRDVIVARALGYAIVLSPRPVEALAWLRNHELPIEPRSWEPEEVEVAASGEIGLTLSRWRLRAGPAGVDSSSAGRQLVLWRYHQVTGWKILLYVAIEQPDAAVAPDSVLQRADPPIHGAHVGTHDEARTEAEALLDADRELGGVAAEKGWAAALAAHATEDVRWLAAGTPSRRGRDAVAAALPAGPCACACEPVGARAAESTDLGYTYGRCSPSASATGAGHAAHSSYVHVWRKDATGTRRVALVLELPAPPDSTR